MVKTLSDLLTAAVLSGTVAVATLAPLPPVAHNGFACVRPGYSEVWVTDSGSPHVAKVFNGYHLCHETLPVDENGYVVFPEA